jgi:hypothetical protein
MAHGGGTAKGAALDVVRIVLEVLVDLIGVVVATRVLDEDAAELPYAAALAKHC